MKLRTVHLMPDDRLLTTHQGGPVIGQPIGPVGGIIDPDALRRTSVVTYRATGDFIAGHPVYELEALRA